MSNKHHDKRVKAKPKDIVLRLIGDGRAEGYPRIGTSITCSLCGATPPEDLTQDSLGSFHTVPRNPVKSHERSCPWRMAYEYVDRHHKLRKSLRPRVKR